MALADAGVDAVLIIGPVTDERGDRAVYLVQQRTDLRAVIDVVGGQRGRHDLARVGISAEVHLAPGPARAGAVLLDQPLARAAQLQARAVDQQVHGLGAGPWSWDLHGLGAAAQGGVVGNRESET